MIRCTNDAGIVAIHSTHIDVMDLDAMAGVQVFDILLGYNLDPLNKLLHSENLGISTAILHNADVDFTNETRGIAGAVHGTYCSLYAWALQVIINHCTTQNSIFKQKITYRLSQTLFFSTI